MRIVRGRAATPDADRDATRQLLREVGETGVPVVRAWTPHRQLAFGRRDANAPGYPEARDAAEQRGFPPVERNVGGRAVAYTGTTLAFAAIEPVDDPRSGLGQRYDGAVASIADALRSLGVDTRAGEPPDAFCPGDHSVQAPDEGADADEGRDADDALRKVAGVAQRVTAGAALVGGVVVVEDAPDIRDVLVPVYRALDVPLDPATVGSVADAGGPADPGEVARAVEDAFAGDREAMVERLDEDGG